MNIINLIFPKKEQSASIIFILMLFSFAILFIRVSITKTLYFLFLIWNIFLAIVPYVITMYLSDKNKINKISFCFIFFIWLVFLPNAPYIVTDLFHLRRSVFQNIWIDTLVLSTFAITGMLIFYFSLFQMKKVLLNFFSIKTSEAIITATIFLSAFGVYIGRFLRYNSWEVISEPIQLFKDILNMVIHPINNKDVWLFTLAFSLFLLIGNSVFNKLKYQR